jgi:protein-S-isoprenylcysteine O-methyltransferase Ste14
VNSDNAGVAMPPPLLFLACLLAGVLAHRIWPIALPVAPVVRNSLAVLLTAAAIVVAFTARQALVGAGTNILPTKPTTAIVTSGIYRYTRNPLYLAMFGLYSAIACAADSLWPFALWVVLLPVLVKGVVEREERYLEAKFGEPYRAYKARVRRWL